MALQFYVIKETLAEVDTQIITLENTVLQDFIKNVMSAVLLVLAESEPHGSVRFSVSVEVCVFIIFQILYKNSVLFFNS